MRRIFEATALFCLLRTGLPFAAPLKMPFAR